MVPQLKVMMKIQISRTIGITTELLLAGKWDYTNRMLCSPTFIFYLKAFSGKPSPLRARREK
jgi:hypothetical protein